MNRKVRHLNLGEEKEHLEILNLCFNHWGSKERWIRRYSQPGFDITKNVIVIEENGEWTGGGAAWFREALINEGKKVKIYIAGDGYVHPSHRGKGVYSSLMRSLNKLGQDGGASLGLGFVSIYGVPFTALPKYGFTDIVYPTSKVFVLNREKFLNFLFSQFRDINFPKTFEGLKFKISVFSHYLNKQTTMDKVFYIKDGKLHEPTNAHVTPKENLDLQLSIGVETLLRFFDLFVLKKKLLFLCLIKSFLRGRLRFRFSLRFLKTILRYVID